MVCKRKKVTQEWLNDDFIFKYMVLTILLKPCIFTATASNTSVVGHCHAWNHKGVKSSILKCEAFAVGTIWMKACVKPPDTCPPRLQKHATHATLMSTHSSPWDPCEPCAVNGRAAQRGLYAEHVRRRPQLYIELVRSPNRLQIQNSNRSTV